MLVGEKMEECMSQLLGAGNAQHASRALPSPAVNRDLGGALPEGSSYCELSSLTVTATSWIFTSVEAGCAELQLPLDSSAGLGGRPGELWLTLRILLKPGHSVGTSWLQRWEESNLVSL